MPSFSSPSAVGHPRSKGGKALRRPAGAATTEEDSNELLPPPMRSPATQHSTAWPWCSAGLPSLLLLAGHRVLEERAFLVPLFACSFAHVLVVARLHPQVSKALVLSHLLIVLAAVVSIVAYLLYSLGPLEGLPQALLWHWRGNWRVIETYEDLLLLRDLRSGLWRPSPCPLAHLAPTLRARRLLGMPSRSQRCECWLRLCPPTPSLRREWRPRGPTDLLSGRLGCHRTGTTTLPACPCWSALR